jgi:hypothetical protein
MGTTMEETCKQNVGGTQHTARSLVDRSWATQSQGGPIGVAWDGSELADRHVCASKVRELASSRGYFETDSVQAAKFGVGTRADGGHLS